MPAWKNFNKLPLGFCDFGSLKLDWMVHSAALPPNAKFWVKVNPRLRFQHSLLCIPALECSHELCSPNSYRAALRRARHSFAFPLEWNLACVVPAVKGDAPHSAVASALPPSARRPGTALRHTGSYHVLRVQFPVLSAMKGNSGAVGELNGLDML